MLCSPKISGSSLCGHYGSLEFLHVKAETGGAAEPSGYRVFKADETVISLSGGSTEGESLVNPQI